jgi:hypothetical protein
MATVSDSRNTQQHPNELKPQERMLETSTEDNAQIDAPAPFTDDLDEQVGEVGSESVGSRYATDWSVDQSS